MARQATGRISYGTLGLTLATIFVVFGAFLEVLALHRAVQLLAGALQVLGMALQVLGTAVLFRGAWLAVTEMEVNRKLQRSLTERDKQLVRIAQVVQRAKEHESSPYRGGAPTLLATLEVVHRLAEDTPSVSSGPFLFHDCGCPVYPRMTELMSAVVKEHPVPTLTPPEPTKVWK